MQLLSDAGLIIKRKSQEGFYDRFRGRLIFPIFDARGQVAGFGGRAVTEGIEPKYLNSPETEVYHKGSILFGLHLSKNDLRQKGEAIVVEGYLDQLSLFQGGIKNVVATLGTALTEEHLQILRPLVKQVVFLFDGDSAGQQAAGRAVRLCIKQGIDGRVVLMPAGQDPDSLIRSKGATAVLEYLKFGQSSLEFLIESYLQGTDRGAQARMRIVENIAPILAEIPDKMAQTLYAKELAERVGVPQVLIESAIRTRGVHKISSERKPDDPSAALNRQDPRHQQTQTEWLILEQIVHHVPLRQKYLREELLDLFEEGPYKLLLAWLFTQYSQRNQWSEVDLISSIENPTLQGSFSALLLSPPTLTISEAERVVIDCVRKMRLQQLSYLERDLLSKIQQFDHRGDVEQAIEALKTYQELVRVQKQPHIAQGG